MNDQLNYYQLVYLLSPLLDEKRVIEFNQKIKKWIEEKQGHLLEQERTAKKNLAYSIKKHQQAICSTLAFQLLPQSIKELQEQLKLEDHILRYIIQKKPGSWEVEPSTSPVRNTISNRASSAPWQKKRDLAGPELAKSSTFLGIKKAPASLPQKVKLEELDKKLEEILNE